MSLWQSCTIAPTSLRDFSSFEAGSKPRSTKINKMKPEPESPAVKLIYEDSSSKVSPSKSAEGSSASSSAASSSAADDDEDLDIPAFLRRIKK